MSVAVANRIEAVLASLWEPPADEDLAAILPRDAESLARFYPTALRAYLDRVETRLEGDVDSAAIVRGEIVSMGKGSVIEAGAIIHQSCRLVLGERSRIRSGAVLRGEVVVGDDCLIGVHCEVWRSVILGPGTALAHGNFIGDSIIGRGAVLSGNIIVANYAMQPGTKVPLRWGSDTLDSRRSHLGALVGDGAKLGASTTLCPGTIVMPGLFIPPGMVLYGTIDAARRRALMDRFFAEWGG